MQSGYDDPEKMVEKDLGVWLDNRPGLFPALYTLCTFALFVGPVVTGLQLGMEPSVVYWIGRHAWMLLLVPFFLLIAHVLHSNARRPQFYAMLLSTVLPSMLVVAVGYSHQTPLNRVRARLDESLWSEGFQKLKDAHVAAERVYDLCISNLATATGRSEKVLRARVCIQECPEYDIVLEGSMGEHQKWRRQWDYLSRLELDQGCAGWDTTANQSLWSAEGSRDGDPCGVAVAGILEGKVLSMTNRLVGSGLLYLIISLLVLLLVQDVSLPRRFGV